MSYPGEGKGLHIYRVSPEIKPAGFEVGDVILGVENQPIDGVGTFIAIASALKPKQTVTLIALDHRSGNVGTIQITVK